MPQARMASPELEAIRAARLAFESAKREVAYKARTHARYWKAWEDSRGRLGPAGDPELRRTADTEYILCRRQMDSLLKPAALAYGQAIFRAIELGQATASGGFSYESAFRNLLDLDVVGQGTGDFLLSRNQWALALDRAAQEALRLCAQKDERGFKLAMVCMTLAGAFGPRPVWQSQIEAVFEKRYDTWVQGGARL